MKNGKTTPESTDNDQPSEPQDGGKRKTVTKVAATAGLVTAMSGNWKQPLMSSVVLPSHAKLTCEPDGADGDCISDGEPLDGIDGLPIDG